jgi:hypothetical protein
MAKWLLVVETRPADATREAEFNEWYDKIHVPDVLETPGFIKAIRYENTEPSEEKAKFLATYEIEADDIDEAMKSMRANLDKKKAEGRYTELLEVVSRGVYRQISSLSR